MSPRRRSSPVATERVPPAVPRGRRSSRRRPDTVPARRSGWLLGGALAVLVLAAVGLVAAGQLGRASDDAGSDGSVTVGIGVGQRAPAFQLTDIDGRTISRDTLRGEPALLWFTTSYCTPCQEGALALQRVLRRIGGEGKLEVVMAFVDRGEPADALAWWRSRFGRPDWITGYASQSMLTDYRVQALDTKYLLDREGVIRVVDLAPLQFAEDTWARQLRSVIGG